MHTRLGAALKRYAGTGDFGEPVDIVGFDDMLIIKGVNVFPSQIETVLLNGGYAANYQIIVDRVNNSDTLEVQVEMTTEMFSR